MKFDCVFTITQNELSTKLEYMHGQYSDEENLIIRSSFQHLADIIQQIANESGTLLTISYDTSLAHPHIQKHISETVILN